MGRTSDEQIAYWKKHSRWLEDELSTATIALAAMTAYARALEQYATTNRVAPGDSEDEAIAALRAEHRITDEMMDGT